jgi:hypothetical protein
MLAVVPGLQVESISAPFEWKPKANCPQDLFVFFGPDSGADLDPDIDFVKAPSRLPYMTTKFPDL